MYTTIGAQPKPADIRAWIFDGGLDGAHRIRCLLLTGDDEWTRVEIPINDHPTLDALQAALDEIRADLPAREPAAAELPIADMKPGELVGVFGK